MSTTARAGFRKPDLVDGANIASSVGDAVDDIDYISLPIYPNTGARDAANPSPVQGQMVYISDTALGGHTLQRYSGAAWINYYPGALFVTTASLTSRAATTTLVADPELAIQVVANTTYEVECGFFINGHASGDFKYDFQFPSSDFSAGQISPGTTYGATTTDGLGTWTRTAVTAATSSAALACGVTDPTIPMLAMVHGILKVGSAGGSFYLRWAQNGSHATATELGAFSWISLDRVS